MESCSKFAFTAGVGRASLRVPTFWRWRRSRRSVRESFPSFGSERMGAPVVAYCRLHEREIRTREPVMEPDCVILIDPTLVHQVDLFAGLKPGGSVLVNSTRTFDDSVWHRCACAVEATT